MLKKNLFNKTLTIVVFYCLFSNLATANTFKICHENTNDLPLISDKRANELGQIQKSVLAAAKAIDVKIDFISAPWKRCLSDLKHGNVDGAIYAIWTAERDKIYAYPKTLVGLEDKSRAIYKAKYKVYVRKDSNIDWNGEKFINVEKKLSAPPGYVANAKLAEMGLLASSEILPKKGMMLVEKGRIDGYIVEEEIGDYILRTRKTKELKKLRKEFMSTDEYVIFSRKTYYGPKKQLIDKFWNQFRKFGIN